MAKYREKIINIQTGEETFRDFTDEEIAALEAEQAQNEAEYAQFIATATAKATARASALAKLIDLGLTEEEIAAL